MKEAYLTIDDSPTRNTDDLTLWLSENGIPAILYCIGSSYRDLNLDCEGMEQNPGPIRRAIDRGFLIANHTLHHRRASELPYETLVDGIEKTERMIEDLYRDAGKSRAHKMIRFPHMDRGCGGHIVDYDAAGRHGAFLKDLFLGGLNARLDPVTPEQAEKKEKIQEYLRREGYSAEGFKGITFDWYVETEMNDAADSLFTFSTADWMVNPDFDPALTRDWPHKSVSSLVDRMDKDETLKNDDSGHIVLAHDHNNMTGSTIELIKNLQKRGLTFIGV